jgi:hypothetical protein
MKRDPDIVIFRALHDAEDLIDAVRSLPSEEQSVSEEERETCRACEGNGTFWADGKAHYPHHNGPTVPCSVCGGTGWNLCAPLPESKQEEKRCVCGQTGAHYCTGKPKGIPLDPWNVDEHYKDSPAPQVEEPTDEWVNALSNGDIHGLFKLLGMGPNISDEQVALVDFWLRSLRPGPRPRVEEKS